MPSAKNCKSIKTITECKSDKDCFWGSMGKGRKPACYNKKQSKTKKTQSKNPEYLMILDTMEQSKKLYEDMNHFGNLTKYLPMGFRIGSSSVHGSVYKISYDGVPLIMKFSKEDTSDSLVYEYLAGICVSHFSFKFPIFSKVVALADLDQDLLYEVDMDKKEMSIDFVHDVKIVNASNIKRTVENGCARNRSFGLISQYLPNTTSVASYVTTCNWNPDKFPNLINHLAFLYICLRGMEDVFTHYDLHSNNVLMVDLEGGKYIDVIIHMNSGDDLHIKMIGIPYIIDYGSIYVNCGMIDTNKVMTDVCESPSCNPECGMYNGYSFNPRYLGNGKFNQANAYHHYFDRTRPNQSHDLKLLNVINEEITVTRGIGNDFKQQITRNIYYKDHYGTPEIKRPNDHKIYNLEGLESVLVPFTQRTDMINGMNALCAGLERYGTLEVWQDMTRDFVLTPN